MCDISSVDSTDSDDSQNSDEYSKFHQTVLNGTISDIKSAIDKGANLAELTKKGKNIVKIVGERQDKDPIIKQIIICEWNKTKYLQELLELDRRIMQDIMECSEKIMELFKNQKFMRLERLPFTDFCSNDYYERQNFAQNINLEEYALVLRLRHMSKCIGLLNRHEKSLKDQCNNLINWNMLQGIEEGLRSHPLWNENRRKLFESISSDCLRLEIFFCEISKTLNQLNIKTINPKRIPFKVQKCECPVLKAYVDWIHDQQLARRSLNLIEVMQKLHSIKEPNEKIQMFYCLQTLGEIIHGFSERITELLRIFHFLRLKNMRNEIKNHWENTIRATDLLEKIKTNFYDDVLNEMRRVLIHFYEPFLQGIINNTDLSTRLDDNSKQETKSITSKFLKLLENKSDSNKDPTSTDISYVIKQIELLLRSIHYICDIIDGHRKDELDTVSLHIRFQQPVVHHVCLFYLTIIGSTVQNMRIKHVFFTTVSVELHEKLDYLRWIRNSLMHYDVYFRSNFYRTTLYDYLSNDLLIEDYSIDSHGQLILVFEQFFEDLEKELINYHEFLSKLTIDNYHIEYKKNDKLFYDKDIRRKQGKCHDFLSKSSIAYSPQYCNNVPSLKLSTVLEKKDLIEKFSKKLDIQVIGIFGPLAQYDSIRNNSHSGLLIEINESNMNAHFFKKLLNLKKYIKNELSLKYLCIVEVHQMKEYLFYQRRQDIDMINIKEIIARYSLGHLKNGLQLHEKIDKFIRSSDDDGVLDEGIKKLLQHKRNICYDASYGKEPILHKLCSIILNTNISCSISLYCRQIMHEILNDGAQINVADYRGTTILHIIADGISDVSCSLNDIVPQEHQNKLDAHKFSNSYQAIPLSVALLKNIHPLKYELGLLTDLCRNANELIIAAIEGDDLEFLQYMTHVVRDDAHQYITLVGMHRNDGQSLIVHITEKLLIQKNLDTIIAILNFLIENEVELRDKNDSWKGCEDLFTELLRRAFHVPVLNLLNREPHVDFYDGSGDYPIHLALKNLFRCATAVDREVCVQLIKKIIENSDNLNHELHGGRDTPLFMAAKHGELDIVKLLLEQKEKVNINYKPYRYCHNMCHKASRNEFEIITLLLEHGLPTSVSDDLGYVENDQLRICLEKCERLFLGYKQGEHEIRDELFQVLRNEPDFRRLMINRRNECGENLLYYAIIRSDVEYIRLLLQYEYQSMNLRTMHTLSKEWPCDPRLYQTYMNHLSCYATGELFAVFVEKNCIEWSSFSFVEVETITDRALRRNDRKLFCLIEQYAYPIISFQHRKHDFVKKYVKVFRILQTYVPYKCRKFFKQLPNRRVLFQKNKNSNYSTLVSITIQKNNFTILKYLVEDLNDDIHSISYCPRESHKISILDNFIVSGHENLEMVEYLINKNVRLMDASNLHQIARFSERLLERFRVYIDNHEDIREFVFKSATKHMGNISFVKFLLTLSTWDPNRYDESGLTPIHLCAEKSFNETLCLLCDTNRVNIEQPTLSTIVWITTGYRTPLGWALEHKNFDGARLLIEKYGASPYEYLLVLLINALERHNKDYVRLLLQKSIIANLEQTWFFLVDDTIRMSEVDSIISFSECERAVTYANNNKELFENCDFILNKLNDCYESLNQSRKRVT